MENFEYRSPTKIVFGKDQLETLPSLMEDHDVKKVLLVYGKSAIKKLGIYDRIHTLLKDKGIEVYEESGVRPNPDLTSVLSGRKTVLENDIDFILAAGGGSVVDAAKAIAFGAKLQEQDVWKTFMQEADYQGALPLGVVLTIAATGSESNGNTVISNDEANDKRSIAKEGLRPQFAIIDPSYTFSVPRHHTFAGSIDIMMHIFEQYFSPTKRTETSDYMSLGVLKSVIENTKRIFEGDDDYDTRANISWAATIGWNWILQKGKVGDWASHRLSYPLTVHYGLTHGYALSSIFPSWIETARMYNPEDMKRRLDLLASEVFGGKGEDVANKLRELFRSWGAPASFKDSEIDLSEDEATNLAKQTVALGDVGNMIKINASIAKEIYLNAR
ncbi:MAG: iron-containing alcohol dehydrogenase [Bacillota bacterium]